MILAIPTTSSTARRQHLHGGDTFGRSVASDSFVTSTIRNHSVTIDAPFSVLAGHGDGDRVQAVRKPSLDNFTGALGHPCGVLRSRKRSTVGDDSRRS